MNRVIAIFALAFLAVFPLHVVKAEVIDGSGYMTGGNPDWNFLYSAPSGEYGAPYYFAIGSDYSGGCNDSAVFNFPDGFAGFGYDNGSLDWQGVDGGIYGWFNCPTLPLDVDITFYVITYVDVGSWEVYETFYSPVYNYGCTDPSASNYNPDSNIDAGNCESSPFVPPPLPPALNTRFATTSCVVSSSTSSECVTEYTVDVTYLDWLLIMLVLIFLLSLPAIGFFMNRFYPRGRNSIDV